MNAAAELREEYKSAVSTYIKHSQGEHTVYRRAEFYEGRMSGLEVALGVLGVSSDEIRELFEACQEETMDELAQEVARESQEEIDFQIPEEVLG